MLDLFQEGYQLITEMIVKEQTSDSFGIHTHNIQLICVYEATL